MLVVVSLVVWPGGFSDETGGGMAGRAREEESGRAILICSPCFLLFFLVCMPFLIVVSYPLQHERLQPKSPNRHPSYFLRVLG